MALIATKLQINIAIARPPTFNIHAVSGIRNVSNHTTGGHLLIRMQRSSGKRQSAGSYDASIDTSSLGKTEKKSIHGSGRHAFLHDFCMCIPYGFFIGLGGLISLILGGGAPSLVVVGAGAAELGFSKLSLQAWKAGKSSALVTLLQAAVAGGVSWLAWQGWNQQASSKIATGGLLALSAVAALFFLYNVLAGGNPPRRSTDKE